MALNRRNFLKYVPLGLAIPGKSLLNLESAVTRPAAAGKPAFSGISRNSPLPDAQSINELYDNAIVIDALCITRGWNAESFDALKKTGYTGLGTSLSSGSMQAALRDLRMWETFEKENPDKIIIATKAADYERAKREGKAAILPGFQNTTMIGSRISNIDRLYEAGTRWIQLTYNARNLIGDGCTERTNAGLSDFGIEAVRRMNELGIFVDLSHCGKQTTFDAILFSDPGPCFTHTMCEALYPSHPRAKNDTQIRAMADKGGVMGIVGLGYMIGPKPGTVTTIKNYIDHIDHAVNVAGIDHVGLSTDFAIQGISQDVTKEDWYVPRLTRFKPSYRVQWPPWIPKLDTVDRYRNVADLLNKRGYSTGDIEKILGLNWLRYYREIFNG